MLNLPTPTERMEMLCQPQTLYTAWRKVRANKGGPGSDGMTIQQFEANLEAHLNQLARQLAEERYYPIPLRKFSIKKPNGGMRELGILAIQDRIVQRAVCDLLEPVFEPQFLDCSFGFRPNRNVQGAITQAMEYRAAGNEWAVDADITKFFDTMDHQVLMRLIKASMKEPPLLRLIQMWLDMGAITHVPAPPPWMEGVEKTAHYVGNAVEQAMTQLLDQGNLGGYRYDEFLPLQPPSVVMPPHIAPAGEETAITEIEPNDSVWKQARREAIAQIGRDGVLLLLSSSKGIFKRLSPKHLFIAAPVILAAAALPTVGGAIRGHLTRPRMLGTVQGSPLSPLFANVYLHEFDKAMTQAGERLVRYADDFLILCPNEDRARHSMELARRHLAGLKLDIHPQKTRIVRLSDNVTFLGYVFDADGCYQPVQKRPTDTIRHQVQQTLKRGISHAKNTGHHLAETGKGVKTRLKTSLKRKKGGGMEES